MIFLYRCVIIHYGDFMKREDIIFYLVIAILIMLGVAAFKFFIKLLPLIVIILIGLLIYDSYKRYISKPVTKKKDKGVKEAEIIKEKNID